MSPGTKWRLLRDSSAQTESSFRQTDTQARTAATKSASATAELSRNSSPIEIKNPCTGKNIRCNAVEGSGKPIIAKVYVHTKRSKIKRTTRKPTAYRRDCNGEKVGYFYLKHTSLQDLVKIFNVSSLWYNAFRLSF